MEILRVSLAAYTGPRYLSMDNMVALALFASNGIIAECSLATTYVRIYCIRPFDKFVYYCPNVDFDAYIDDLTVGATGTKHQVQSSVIEGGSFLYKVVVDDLVCKIAMDKPAL
eukprot:10970455-Heterocapsa_arctica.AAC.1